MMKNILPPKMLRQVVFRFYRGLNTSGEERERQRQPPLYNREREDHIRTHKHTSTHMHAHKHTHTHILKEKRVLVWC